MAETRILEGRRAIVTGASRGIGAEIATAMARAGAAVVVAARDEAALARVAAQIEGEGGRAVVAPADISEPDAVERLVATTVDALGGLDIAVNNAAGGGHGPTPLADVNGDQFRSALAIAWRASSSRSSWRFPRCWRAAAVRSSTWHRRRASRRSAASPDMSPPSTA
jgi:NAD(P)-dependent dehydrogenase (short-subunit alcohol dehydrogenase family)